MSVAARHVDSPAGCRMWFCPARGELTSMRLAMASAASSSARKKLIARRIPVNSSFMCSRPGRLAQPYSSNKPSTDYHARIRSGRRGCIGEAAAPGLWGCVSAQLGGENHGSWRMYTRVQLLAWANLCRQNKSRFGDVLHDAEWLGAQVTTNVTAQWMHPCACAHIHTYACACGDRACASARQPLRQRVRGRGGVMAVLHQNIVLKVQSR